MALLGKLLQSGLEEAGEDIAKKAFSKGAKKTTKEVGESTLAKIGKKIPVSMTSDFPSDFARVPVKVGKNADDIVTLYRGLTQKYDPKFPVSKLDTSGYESFTDNLDLARQYGDNVVSINVPKRDIKTSYLDENPMSPTYGDRNPIYSIDKPAGLNGVSGKEYLLEVGSDYQKALKYNEIANDLDNASKYMGPFYHSSDAVFDRFDDAMLGSNTGYDNTAFGHFLTQDKDFSKKFGKNTGEYYANIQKPIIHPYMAELKYPDSEQLDKIVTEYLEATNNAEALDNFRQFVDDGTYKDLYDAYMSSLHFEGTDPYEFSDMEKPLLQDKGYDAIEIIEGLKKQLLPELDDATPVSSYAVFSGDAIRKATDIPDELKNELINSGAGKYISGVTFDKNDAKSVYDYVKLNSQPNLDGILKDISDETGFSFYGGKNKSVKSMEAKVKRKNAVGKQYGLMDMKDHARGAYQIDSLNNNEAIANFLDRMKEKVGAPLNVENVRSGMGYNGLHITWRSPDGIGFEVQVTTPEAWKVKKISDKIYDKWRNITDVTKLSKDEFRKYIKDVQYSNKLWKELNLPDLKKWENYLK